MHRASKSIIHLVKNQVYYVIINHVGIRYHIIKKIRKCSPSEFRYLDEPEEHVDKTISASNV